ncbi:hypothetical protein SBADM41S_05250 [Streptomyces badius]
MAKKSKIAKNEQRRLVVARYAARRAELKEIVRRPSSTEAERLAAQRELRRQPRDAGHACSGTASSWAAQRGPRGRSPGAWARMSAATSRTCASSSSRRTIRTRSAGCRAAPPGGRDELLAPPGQFRVRRRVGRQQRGGGVEGGVVGVVQGGLEGTVDGAGRAHRRWCHGRRNPVALSTIG